MNDGPRGLVWNGKGWFFTGSDDKCDLWNWGQF